jgi:methionyl-tRNA formyltransferase
MWNGQIVKVVRTQVTEGMRDGEIGRVVKLSDGSIGVVTGEGVLVLKEIQLAGRKALKAEDFVRGQPKFIGAVLG